jgi:hypothetical protein
MEAAFMMLFLLLLIDNLMLWEKSSRVLTTVAFTGLMYTRPDWFVYAGSIVAAFVWFKVGYRSPAWGAIFRYLGMPLAIGLVFYLPWLLATWMYYGSIIPNTITAKVNLMNYSVASMFKHLVLFPYYFVKGETCASRIFMPPYASGGWFGLEYVSWIVCVLCVSCGFLPAIPALARALALSGAFGIYYLTYVSGQGPMPWYLPNLALQFILIFVCLSHWLARRFSQKVAAATTGAFCLVCLAILLLGGYQIRVQQQVIEYGNRKRIGEWLRDNSAPTDTVFMECLGYIGFYSQLKTYDFPGMSSKEVVAIMAELRKKNAISYAPLIERLKPSFLILRPWEYQKIMKENRRLLEEQYKSITIFDVRGNVPDKWYLRGKHNLLYDAVFLVMKRVDNPAVLSPTAP